MNDDEAEKCLSLAKDKFRQGHLDQALKFARKAKALNSTFEAAEDYIDFLLIAKEKAARESARGNAATAQAPDSEGVRHRPAKASASASTSTPPAAKEEPTREYTAVQVEAVKEVLRLKGDYYKCLGVERTCTEVELKKAYRKVRSRRVGRQTRSHQLTFRLLPIPASTGISSGQERGTGGGIGL
jgi:DnaJ family protein B protein 12